MIYSLNKCGVAPDGLRRLPEGAQEGAAHALAIGEAGLAGDNVDRVPALLHHQPRRFDAQMFDRLGRRLSRLGVECAAELARAQMRGLGQLLDRQRVAQVAPGIVERLLDAVGLGIQVEQCRMLRLPAGAAVIDDELAARPAREIERRNPSRSCRAPDRCRRSCRPRSRRRRR